MMKTYHYRARDLNGALSSGNVVADTLKSAKTIIAQKGLVVISAKESPLEDLKAQFRKMFEPKVTTDDLIMFSRQTQIIYTVGIPILQGLQLVLDQTTNPRLAKAITMMIKDIAEGSTLYGAMTKHTDVFDPVYINLVRVGEGTGGLEAMLERGSRLIEEQAGLKAKLKSATFYPKVVVTFFGLVFLIVVYGILPRLKTFFVGLGSDLPVITRTVMGVSDFFVHYWYLVAGLIALGFWTVRKILSIPEYRLKYDRLLFRLPIFGLLFQQIEVNTFCIILDILLNSGVAIVESFVYVEASARNTAFAKDVAACRDSIARGETLAKGLAPAETFPSLVKGLIGTGEEGGKLPDVLQQISRYYRIQIDHRIDNLAKLIEPILLFFIFGLVLILALAVFMPMWKMSSALKR